MSLETEKYESSSIEDQKADAGFYQQEDVAAPLKLDNKGLPLIPQPTDSTSDPLNWPRAWKYFIVAQCCILCFFAQFAFAVMNPAYAQVAKVRSFTNQQSWMLLMRVTGSPPQGRAAGRVYRSN